MLAKQTSKLSSIENKDAQRPKPTPQAFNAMEEHSHVGFEPITGASLVDQYPITLVHIVGFKIIKN